MTRIKNSIKILLILLMSAFTLQTNAMLTKLNKDGSGENWKLKEIDIETKVKSEKFKLKPSCLFLTCYDETNNILVCPAVKYDLKDHGWFLLVLKIKNPNTISPGQNLFKLKKCLRLETPSLRHINKIVYDPKNSIVIVATRRDEKFFIVDLNAKESDIREIKDQKNCKPLSFNPEDPNLLAIKEIKYVDNTTHPKTDIAKRLVEETFKILNLKTNKVVKIVDQNHIDHVSQIFLSPCWQFLIFLFYSNEMHIYRKEEKNEVNWKYCSKISDGYQPLIFKIDYPNSYVKSYYVSLSPSKKLLAVAFSNGEIKIFCLKTNKLIKHVYGKMDPKEYDGMWLYSMKFVDEETIVCGYKNGAIRFLDVETGIFVLTRNDFDCGDHWTSLLVDKLINLNGSEKNKHLILSSHGSFSFKLWELSKDKRFDIQNFANCRIVCVI